MRLVQLNRTGDTVIVDTETEKSLVQGLFPDKTVIVTPDPLTQFNDLKSKGWTIAENVSSDPTGLEMGEFWKGEAVDPQKNYIALLNIQGG
jgi:hypothetical protein